MAFTRHIVLFLFLFLPVQAQEDSGDSSPLSALGKKREALARALVQKATLESEIAEARKKAGDAELTEFEREEAAQTIAALQLQIEELESEFSRVATGVDLDSLGTAGSESIDINEEIREVFRPLIQEFRDITSAPREAEDLRTEIADLK